ncbi:MAG: tryptophan synthase subunit alpha [Candidatus Puniceispirillales bacterium]
MNRIKKTFANLKKNNKKALGIFLTAGDPDLATSLDILVNLPKNGADFIEIGMPFSDPMADGPVIQESSERALKSGMNLEKCLSLVKTFRKINNEVPIILMGYFNPIYKYGREIFVKKALEYGVDGLIIVDLPPEEDEELYNYSEKHNLSLIRLITPTTNKERLARILNNATGFIYYVSITGITGTQAANPDDVLLKLDNVRQYTKLPVVIGFGIRTPEQAFKMSKISDGIVVGSAVVEKIKYSLDDKNKATKSTLSSCLKFISEISNKLRYN